MRQWIRYQKHMSPLHGAAPGASELYIVHFSDYAEPNEKSSVSMARYVEGKGWCYYDGTKHTVWRDRITHYMELPAPPTSGEEGWIATASELPYSEYRNLKCGVIGTLIVYRPQSVPQTGAFRENGVGFAEYSTREGWVDMSAGVMTPAAAPTHWMSKPDAPADYKAVWRELNTAWRKRKVIQERRRCRGRHRGVALEILLAGEEG